MAYIIGLCSNEEVEELKRRGWEIEKPPKSLYQKRPIKGYQTVMVWVDSDMIDIMSGPDWDPGPKK